MTNPNQQNINNLLDDSCEQLSPSIQQKLNSRRNLAKRPRKTSWFPKVGFALAPLALLVAVWVQQPVSNLSGDQAALYDDIDLLLIEDQLEFLDEMDLSSWLDEEQNQQG